MGLLLGIPCVTVLGLEAGQHKLQIWVRANVCFARPVARRTWRQKDKSVWRRTAAEGVADLRKNERSQTQSWNSAYSDWLESRSELVTMLPCRILLHYFVYIVLVHAGYHRDGATLSTSRWEYELLKTQDVVRHGLSRKAEIGLKLLCVGHLKALSHISKRIGCSV